MSELSIGSNLRAAIVRSAIIGLGGLGVVCACAAPMDYDNSTVSQPQTGQQANSTPTSTPIGYAVMTSTPGASGHPKMRMVADRESPRFSPADYAQLVDVVAEVNVIDVLPLQFNTSDGAIPADLDDANGMRLFRPVILKIDRFIKGDDSTLTGFISSEDGGVVEDYEYRVDPPMSLTLGSEGTVFINRYSPDELADPLDDYLLQKLLSVASSMGTGFEPALVQDWYYYDGSDAESTNSRQRMTRSELEQQIATGLTYPTP